MPAKKTKTVTKAEPAVEASVRHWGKDEVEYVKAPEIPVLYANNAQIAFNNFDVSLVLGEIMEAADKLRVAPKVKVTISLPFALELRDLLVRNIAVFEDKFGPIHTPGKELIIEDAQAS